MRQSEVVDNRARRSYWEARLLPIRLDAEPVLEQLERRRWVVLVLSAIIAAVSSIVLVLFAAFGRPDIGAILGLLFAMPMISVAWLDFHVLKGKVRRYLVELEGRKQEQEAPGPV